MLGEREVTFLHVTEWIEKKLKHEFQVPGLLFRGSANPAEAWALLPVGESQPQFGPVVSAKSQHLVWSGQLGAAKTQNPNNELRG